MTAKCVARLLETHTRCSTDAIGVIVEYFAAIILPCKLSLSEGKNTWYVCNIRGDNTLETYVGKHDKNTHSALVPFSHNQKKDGIVSVSCGFYHTVAVRDDGTLRAWGEDWYRLLAQKPQGDNFVEVSARGHYSVALDDEGNLHMRGVYKYSGTLPNVKFVSVSAGYDRVVAIDDSGTMWEWSIYRDTAADPVVRRGAYVKAVAGLGFSAALSSDGTLETWGALRQTSRDKFVTTGLFHQTSRAKFVAICAGQFHLITIDTEGALHVFGDDTYRQISDMPRDAGYTDVAAGAHYSVARKEDGTLKCWGVSDKTTRPDLFDKLCKFYRAEPGCSKFCSY